MPEFQVVWTVNDNIFEMLQLDLNILSILLVHRPLLYQFCNKSWPPIPKHLKDLPLLHYNSVHIYISFINGNNEFHYASSPYSSISPDGQTLYDLPRHSHQTISYVPASPPS